MGPEQGVCRTCNGKKTVTVQVKDPNTGKEVQQQKECPSCQGSGTGGYGTKDFFDAGSVPADLAGAQPLSGEGSEVARTRAERAEAERAETERAEVAAEAERVEHAAPQEREAAEVAAPKKLRTIKELHELADRLDKIADKPEEIRAFADAEAGKNLDDEEAILILNAALNAVNAKGVRELVRGVKSRPLPPGG